MFGNCALKKTSLRIINIHLLRARRLSAVQQITISKCSCYVCWGLLLLCLSAGTWQFVGRIPLVLLASVVKTPFSISQSGVGKKAVQMGWRSPWF